jgi:hypothetical protein
MLDETEIKHDQSGDSEYTFKVTMKVGWDDQGSSTVSIGTLHFNIQKRYSEENKKNYYIVEEGSYENIMYGCPEHNTKWDAVEWLINKLKGT